MKVAEDVCRRLQLHFVQLELTGISVFVQCDLIHIKGTEVIGLKYFKWTILILLMFRILPSPKV